MNTKDKLKGSEHFKYSSKDFKTIQERIEILKSRKLLFNNQESAEEILLAKNYFDIVNGFETLLLKDPKSKTKEYLPNSYFEYFNTLYTFDKKLSAKILTLIDSFENRLKSSISYRFCEEVFINNPDAPPDSYLDPLMYEYPFSVYHQIRMYPSATWTTEGVTKLNIYIENKVTKEIINLSRKINRLPSSIEYTSKNKKMLNLISECENLLSKTNDVITDTNLMIGKIVPDDKKMTVKKITPFSFVNVKINFLKVTTKTEEDIETIRKDIKYFMKNIKEINSRIAKVCAHLAPNNNLIGDNLLNEDISPFLNHNFFKTNHKINNVEFDYIEYTKAKYEYLKTFDTPPFWVIIKTLDLGGLRKILPGLKVSVLEQVVDDMGLPVVEKVLFLNSVKIIQDLRNSCAHFNLVNRFRTNRITDIDTNLITKLGLNTKNRDSSLNSHYEIRLFDTLKVLAQFENFNEIHDLFGELFGGTNLPQEVIEKLLDRMGNSERIKWLGFNG
ncbi:Abi family protein [Exiguobacterium sp. S90]|uniref:Abi family protein n=1 Tax=Exiguobacterium sp. S90 TaxID=1221231 RepID=UPI001BEA2A08|nr:Abi family protein [Exiguobacterium sp. S90]